MKKIIISVIAFAGLLVTGTFVFLYMFPQKAVSVIVNAERSNAGLELKQRQVDGLQYKYLQGGSGETLILLHGFGANKDNWTRIAGYLTPHFSVVAPDLPGYGESDRPDSGGYTITEQMERIHGFVKSLTSDPIHLGGSSMGGNIAAAYAATYENELKSLWLIAPGGVFSAEPSKMNSLLKNGENPLIAGTYEEYTDLVDFVFYKTPYIPGPVLKAFAREAIENEALNKQVFKAIFREPVKTDEVLNGSRIPALVTWGKNDNVLHYSGAKILQKKMKNVKIHLIDKTGHLPMIEKPEETAGRYLEFYKSL